MQQVAHRRTIPHGGGRNLTGLSGSAGWMGDIIKLRFGLAGPIEERAGEGKNRIGMVDRTCSFL